MFHNQRHNQDSDHTSGEPTACGIHKVLMLVTILLAVIASLVVVSGSARSQISRLFGFDREIETNAKRMLAEGKQTFRLDTFGDEAFWGDMLQLHQAIQGAEFGGVVPG